MRWLFSICGWHFLLSPKSSHCINFSKVFCTEFLCLNYCFWCFFQLDISVQPQVTIPMSTIGRVWFCRWFYKVTCTGLVNQIYLHQLPSSINKSDLWGGFRSLWLGNQDRVYCVYFVPSSGHLTREGSCWNRWWLVFQMRGGVWWGIQTNDLWNLGGLRQDHCWSLDNCDPLSSRAFSGEMASSHDCKPCIIALIMILFCFRCPVCDGRAS